MTFRPTSPPREELSRSLLVASVGLQLVLLVTWIGAERIAHPTHVAISFGDLVMGPTHLVCEYFGSAAWPAGTLPFVGAAFVGFVLGAFALRIPGRIRVVASLVVALALLVGAWCSLSFLIVAVIVNSPEGLM